MEHLEIINKFLLQWEHKDIIDGVLLTGSRSVGNEKENSDIDLQILISDTSFRQRGNTIVDGVLVEYFANPTAYIERYLTEELTSNYRSTIRMYATGKIIFDPYGFLESACQKAQQLISIPFAEMTATSIESAKYSVWDSFDDLTALYRENCPAFSYVFHLNLNKVLQLYCKFLQTELASPSKQWYQFSDAGFRNKYGLNEFPDNTFASLFLACINASDPLEMYTSMESLTQWVLNSMGGFKIDGWTSTIAP